MNSFITPISSQCRGGLRWIFIDLRPSLVFLHFIIELLPTQVWKQPSKTELFVSLSADLLTDLLCCVKFWPTPNRCRSNLHPHSVRSFLYHNVWSVMLILTFFHSIFIKYNILQLYFLRRYEELVVSFYTRIGIFFISHPFISKNVFTILSNFTY